MRKLNYYLSDEFNQFVQDIANLINDDRGAIWWHVRELAMKNPELNDPEDFVKFLKSDDEVQK